MTPEGIERESKMLKERTGLPRDVVGQYDHFSENGLFCILRVVLPGHCKYMLLTKTDLSSFDRLQPSNHKI